MKNQLIALTLASAAIAAPASFAGNDSGLYLGGAIASSSIDLSEPNISADDNDNGYKLIGGYNFGLIPMLDLAVELNYIDFGSHQTKVTNVADGSVSSTGISATGIINLKLAIFGLYGKAGVMSWDSDLKVLEDKRSDSGSDTAYGLGAKVQLGSVAVRAEYELFKLDQANLDLFSIGATYTF